MSASKTVAPTTGSLWARKASSRPLRHQAGAANGPRACASIVLSAIGQWLCASPSVLSGDQPFSGVDKSPSRVTPFALMHWFRCVINQTFSLMRTHFVVASSTALIRHCEEHSDVAISMRLNTRRRTAVATTTGLPRYARNDKVGTVWTFAVLTGRRRTPRRSRAAITLDSCPAVGISLNDPRLEHAGQQSRPRCVGFSYRHRAGDRPWHYCRVNSRAFRPSSRRPALRISMIDDDDYPLMVVLYGWPKTGGYPMSQAGSRPRAARLASGCRQLTFTSAQRYRADLQERLGRLLEVDIELVQC